MQAYNRRQIETIVKAILVTRANFNYHDAMKAAGESHGICQNLTILNDNPIRCIVGEILHWLGVPDSHWHTPAGAHANSNNIIPSAFNDPDLPRFSLNALIFMYTLQLAQDGTNSSKGATWGAAYGTACKNVPYDSRSDRDFRLYDDKFVHHPYLGVCSDRFCTFGYTRSNKPNSYIFLPTTAEV